MLERFLPYPDTLVVTTSVPDTLAQVLASTSGQPAEGMPGLRYEYRNDHATLTHPATFVHLPTGATLRVHHSTRTPTAQAASSRHEGPGSTRHGDLTAHERRVLESLPEMTADAEQLLAALLIRLPMADPSGIWTLANRHLGPAWHSKPAPIGPYDDNSAFLWGDGDSWHFRWDGPVSAVDIAAALTDTLVGLSGATAVLQRWHPLVIHLGTATLTLHGNL